MNLYRLLLFQYEQFTKLEIIKVTIELRVNYEILIVPNMV